MVLVATNEGSRGGYTCRCNCKNNLDNCEYRPTVFAIYP